MNHEGNHLLAEKLEKKLIHRQTENFNFKRVNKEYNKFF